MNRRRPASPADRFHAAVGRMSTLGFSFSSVAIVLLMLITVADVASRYFRAQSLPGVVEINQVVLVIAVFGGFGYAQRTRQHVSTEVVTDRLPPRVATIVRRIGIIVLVVALIPFAFEASQAAINSYRSGEFRFGMVQVPVWPARAAIAFGFVAVLAETLSTVMRGFSGDPAVGYGPASDPFPGPPA